LVEDGRILSETLLHIISTTHSEKLLKMIEYVLSESGYTPDAIDGWAIALGPGSFTGLRIGVSTVKGLAFATGKPALGVPTLDILASQVSPTPYLICPILDARKKEVYTALYRYEGGELPVRRSPYQAIKPEDLVMKIDEKTIFTGDGTIPYGDYLRKTLPEFAIVPASSFHVGHGSTVAALGLDLLLKQRYLKVSSVVPIYVRSPEAELKLQKPGTD